jgi:predicted DNA-binding transcriptional regulator AlpA
MNQPAQAITLAAKSSRRYFQRATQRCYTATDICRELHLSRRTFYLFKKQGRLPLVELLPRLGRTIRYQAAPIDRWLDGRG